MWERVGKLENFLRPHVPFTVLNTVLRFLDKNARTLLDVGCGKGEPMLSIRAKRRLSMVGVDAFLPYLKEAKAAHRHDEYVLGDVCHLPFRPRSFDVVLAMEVLEHLTNVDGLALLESMEQIARRQVIITTPVGRYVQEPYDGNPHQEHKHIWQPEELKKLGYRVRTLALRSMGGMSGVQSPLPQPLRPLANLVWVMAGPVTYFVPRLAGNMVCVKRLG